MTRARKTAPAPRGPGRPRLEPGDTATALTIRLGPGLAAKLERIKVRRKLGSLAAAARAALEDAPE